VGGKNETVICGLRFHENNGNVHIHDDAKKLKFEAPADEWKEDIKSAFVSLKDKEGVVKIMGTRNDLYVMKQGKSITVFLMDNSSIEKKLQEFIRDI